MKTYISISAFATVVCALFAVAMPNDASALKIDEGCKPVEAIFARGSGTQLEQENTEGPRFISQLRKRIPNEHERLQYYELGSEDYDGNQYPADPVKGASIATGVGAFLSAGYHFKYGDSVKEGISELKYYITNRHNKCKDETKWILGGFSQGAQVIGQSLNTIDKDIRDDIVFVALFGDPKLHLPEGEGIFPEACFGKMYYSKWRREIDDCTLDNGSLYARIPYLPSDMHEKTGLWCYENDYVCGTSKNPLNTSGHSKYKEPGKAIDVAVQEAITKLDATGDIQYEPDPETGEQPKLDTSMPEPETLPLELAFVLNTGYSMRAYVDETRKNELVNMGRSYLNSLKSAGLTGRIALVEYRDADSTHPARVLSDLTADADEFERAVREKLDYERTPSDDPEGALHGYMTAMKELSWSAPGESEKGILLNSRFGFHEPDRTDSSTQLDVLQETYRLGGVYLMTATANEHKDQYRYLAKSTDGIVTELMAFEPTDEVTNLMNEDNSSIVMRSAQATPGKLVAALSSGNYKARPGDAITFDASGSYVNNGSIIRYEWDIDGDGYIDHASSEPVFEYVYPAQFDGMIRVQVYDNYGRKASDYAHVEISNKTPQPVPAAPSGFKAQITQTIDNKSTVELTWNAADAQTERWILTMNDDAMGYMSSDRRSVTITDVERAENVVFGLVAQNSDEVRSSFAELTIAQPTSAPTEPEQPTDPTTPPQPTNPCNQTNVILRKICELQEYVKRTVYGSLWQLQSSLGTR